MMQVDVKQTSLLVLTLAAFSFLGYQIYQMVSNDVMQPDIGTSYSVSTPSQPQWRAHVAPTAAKRAAHTSNQPAHEEQAERLEALENAHAVTADKANSHGSEPPLFHTPLRKEQQQYLNMVNQYEMAKMQRQLLEEQAAIAEAKRKILTITQQTQKIQTSQHASRTDQEQTLLQRYKLTYLDQQDDQWDATLRLNKRFIEVRPGSLLPGGIKVDGIDKDGVIMRSGSKRIRLTFDGPMTLRPVPWHKKAAQADGQTLRLQNQLYQLKHKLRLQQQRLLAQQQAEQVKKQQEAQLAKRLGLAPIGLQVKVPPLLSAQTMLQHPQQPEPSMSLAEKLLSEDDSGFSVDERVIMQRDNKHYTIRLLLARKAFVVNNFVEANHLQEDALKYSMLRHGQRFYALVYGDYPDQESARQALDALPASIKVEQPRLRQYAVVKKAIQLGADA